MKKKERAIFNASIEELTKGFREEEHVYTCLFCEQSFTKGRIYEIDELLFDAKKATTIHIEKSHESPLIYLLGIEPTLLGISEIQREFLLLSTKFADKEIAERLGITQSTVRNHRFKLREKEKQARLFLAAMELLTMKERTELPVGKNEKLYLHPFFERYNITQNDVTNTIKTYFDEKGKVTTYPAKEKRKIIILVELMKLFEKERTYTEKEINEHLKAKIDDYVTVRRALIEFDLLDRSKDGSMYWVKG